MTTPAVLVANALSFSYGSKLVFDGLQLKVSAGEILGVLGPNGAGKTTLLKCLVGTATPQVGSIHLFGENVTQWPLWRRARHGLAYLTQGASLIPDLTVLDNVRLASRNPNSKRVGAAALGRLGLEHLADASPRTLSGGERRQVELARLFASEHKLLILDEPYAALDPKARQKISRMLKYFQANGRTLVVTDHDVLTTLNVVSRAVVLVDGKICCEGNQAKILQDTFVRAHYLGEEEIS